MKATILGNETLLATIENESLTLDNSEQRVNLRTQNRCVGGTQSNFGIAKRGINLKAEVACIILLCIQSGLPTALRFVNRLFLIMRQNLMREARLVIYLA